MPGSDRLRLFFALVPPEPVRRAMAAIQSDWALPARTVRPESLHLTLAFLGAVQTTRLGGLAELAAGLDVPVATLVLDRLGWFPRSRVAWLGASAAPEPLAGFQYALSTALAGAGFRAEGRRWQPHVSLYRDLRTAPAKIDFEPVDWRIEGFELMCSRPVPGGVEYRSLGAW